MSKTDKTDPYWVKRFIYGEIRHNHSKGECRYETIDSLKASGVMSGSYRWSDAPCEFYAGYRSRKYLANAALWGRHGCIKEKAALQESRARAQTRKSLREALKGDVEAVVEPTRHRHNAVWYW